MRHPPSSHAEKGFSFLEALFALLILSLGVVGFLSVFAQMLHSAAEDEFTFAASQLAGEKLEQILAAKAAAGYDAIPNAPTTEELNIGTHAFTRVTSVKWVDPSDLTSASGEETGYKRVDITVSWSSGEIKQVQMTGLISNY